LILNSQKKYQKEVCDKMTEIDAFRQFLIKKNIPEYLTKIFV